jgi:hypothetical protein
MEQIRQVMQVKHKSSKDDRIIVEKTKIRANRTKPVGDPDMVEDRTMGFCSMRTPAFSHPFTYCRRTKNISTNGNK